MVEDEARGVRQVLFEISFKAEAMPSYYKMD